MSVTCIVPVYNGERFLKEALDSVLDQAGVPDLDVLVVDDGSTDTTPDVLETYGDRIRVLRQANAGVAAARNLGLSEATGEFIAFQDADDIWSRASFGGSWTALRRIPISTSVLVRCRTSGWTRLRTSGRFMKARSSRLPRPRTARRCWSRVPRRSSVSVCSIRL